MDSGNKRQKYSKGRWRVERERHHLSDFYPTHPDKGTSSISDVLPNLMRKIGLAEEHWVAVLQEEWGVLVGKAVAKHTRPGRMQKRHLVVFVDSSVWLSELSRYGGKSLLSNLQERFGVNKIGSVSFRIDPGDEED